MGSSRPPHQVDVFTASDTPPLPCTWFRNQLTSVLGRLSRCWPARLAILAQVEPLDHLLHCLASLNRVKALHSESLTWFRCLVFAKIVIQLENARSPRWPILFQGSASPANVEGFSASRASIETEGLSPDRDVLSRCRNKINSGPDWPLSRAGTARWTKKSICDTNIQLVQGNQLKNYQTIYDAFSGTQRF